MSAMTAGKIKWAVLVLMLAGLLAGGAAAVGWSASGGEDGEPGQAQRTEQPQPDEPVPRSEDTKGQDVDPPAAYRFQHLDLED